MVNVSIDVTDLGGEARPGDKVTLWRPRVSGSASRAGGVVSTAPVTVFLTEGKATVSNVEPGDMRVLLQCRGVESQGPIDVIVPDGTGIVTLRSLIESQFEYSPPVVSAVQEAADNAAASERAAIQAQVRSEAAADRAEAEVEDAINNGADLVRNEVKQDADRAVSARDAAEGHADLAATSESNAVAFQAAAASAAFSAKTSETNTKASETNAASSAASAKSQQESALTHLNNTVAEAEKAAGSASAAKDSETKAASSASASASSASSSKTQADKSATSATQAAAARDAAEDSADAAAGSAAAAKDSETNAAQSSSSANTHRADAASQAVAAAQDATRAESARDAAQAAQSAAKDSETNADAHRQAAATSETNAAAHETNSGASAEAAATSATEAKGHADRAEQMADPDGLRNEITQQLADLVDGAPEDLDTIREVAEYAQENRDITDQLNAAIGNKADKSHTHAWASITGRPDIPVMDVGYRIRWADHAPNLYPAGVSVSMSATDQGWGAALAASIPDYVDDGFVVILTIRNGKYDQSAIQMVFSYTNVTRPVYIRKYNGEVSGWSNFRRLTNDGHKHTVSDISDLPPIRMGTSASAIVQRKSDAQIMVPAAPVDNLDAASKKYVDARPALFSGTGAPPSSIAGAVAGDFWLDVSTMELHKITGV